MVWQGRIDLPSELERKLPRPATETLVAFLGIAIAIGMRLAIERLLGDVVPFALTFPVIVGVILLAGTRAGLMTLFGCQLLIWYYILPPRDSFAIDDLTTAANLVLVTVAQLMLVWAVSAYRRSMRASIAASRDEIDGLSMALREIDHRTRNNFQLAIAMLNIQARSAEEPEVRAGLDKAAARLQVIASVYRNLALSSASLDEIRLHDHLEEICERLREGLLSGAIQLEFRADPIVAPQDLAIRIGLIVNELITNAAKHAFPDGNSEVVVELRRLTGDYIALEVRDNGKGFGDGPMKEGLGSRLIAMLARQIGAESESHRQVGTIHRYRIRVAR